MSSLRVRNWMITLYNLETKIEINDDVTYFIYQLEECPTTGSHHHQGYFEFSRALTWGAIKKLFNDNTVHCEIRRGTQKQAVEYCSKSATKIGDCIVGGTLKKQGERTELSAVYDMLIDGQSPASVLMAMQDIGVRNIGLITKSWMVLHGNDPTEKMIEEEEKLDKAYQEYKPNHKIGGLFKLRIAQMQKSLNEE